MTAVGTGLLATLAGVLAWAGALKLRRPSAAGRTLASLGVPGSVRVVRWVAGAEIVVAAAVAVLPARASGIVLATVFAGFTATHRLMSARRLDGDCGCFGEEQSAGRTPWARQVMLTGSALAGVVVAALAPPSPVALAGSEPGVAVAAGIGACAAAALWRAVFDGRAVASSSTVAERLVDSSALFLERRCSRRTALLRIAVAGSALCVAPLRYLLYPGSALAAISPSSCSGGLCTDGYTAFCCEINNGRNSCPGGTFPGGWWMCTDYRGSQLCSHQGVRYYVDCNRLPGHGYGCTCANNRCSERRVACNVFRYGQCNPQIPGTTEVVCRMVTCQNPGSIPGLHCSSSVSVDNAVCGQDVPCLKPRAIELAGAGGV